MGVFLESEEPECNGFLKWLEQMEGNVTTTDLDKYKHEMPVVGVPSLSHQLYLILAGTLERGLRAAGLGPEPPRGDGGEGAAGLAGCGT